MRTNHEKLKSNLILSVTKGAVLTKSVSVLTWPQHPIARSILFEIYNCPVLKWERVEKLVGEYRTNNAKREGLG